ncbi:DUF4214 domain-containing protein [Rugamonas sp. DEMB1]|uniref:DUF4214 domain-containing protein n=1 Tax=Rugamonas sp. DEMB1 TaxID=3039386 RepID=UPI002449F044|nr:DUF4214 domain-containing protein [Rugamonas sp. DEMB1]WGG49491.1 DUF4214 domain-containing protein [Rugamonas sp. DEMB1]
MQHSIPLPAPRVDAPVGDDKLGAVRPLAAALPSAPASQFFEAATPDQNHSGSLSLDGLTYSADGSANVDVIRVRDVFDTTFEMFEGKAITSNTHVGFDVSYFQFSADNPADQFKLNRLAANAGEPGRGYAQRYSITGLSGGATVVEVTLDLGESATYGSGDQAIVYERDSDHYNGGRLHFGAAWNKIDTVRFSGQDGATALTLDSIRLVAPVAPAAISGAGYDAASGVLSVSGSGLHAGDGIDTGKLSLTGQGGASYVLTSDNVGADSDTGFSITLNAVDRLHVNGLLNLAGTAAVDGGGFALSAAAGWNQAAAGSADVGENVVTVANVRAPAIGGARYDAASGVLSVSASDLVKLAGAGNDIVAAKLTLSGEGGQHYTLSDTANVEVDSADGFSLTLSAHDRAALNLLLNQNGASASGGAGFGLSAGAGWNGIVGAGDHSVAGQTLTVSNVAVPAIGAVSYAAASGTLSVGGSGFLSRAGAANDIVASKFTLSGTGGVSYTLSDSADVDVSGGGSFTLVLSVADRAAVNQLLEHNGAASWSLAVAEGWAAGAGAGVPVADSSAHPVTLTGRSAPTLGAFAGAVASTDEDVQQEVTLAQLLAAGNAADSDGGVDAFVVRAVASGQLRLGASAATATAWSAGGNDVIDAGHHAYWTPAANANGGAVDAFSVVARDNDGLSSPTPVVLALRVDAVNDLPTGAVTIGGRAVAGQSLTALSALADADGLGVLHYQWQANGVDIDGATGAELLLGNTLLGKTIRVVAAYTDLQGHAEQVNSAASDAVAAAAPPRPPAPDPQPDPAPPLIDGVRVDSSARFDSAGHFVTTLSVAPVGAERQDDHSTPNQALADIPLAQGDAGTLLMASLSAGLGLSSDSIHAGGVREQLIAGAEPRLNHVGQLARIVGDGIDQYLAGLHDQSQVTVRALTLTAADGAGNGAAPTLLISGASGTGNADPLHPLRQEALVIDTYQLPAGAVLQLEQVEFAVVIGAGNVRGSAGDTFAIGDDGQQVFRFGSVPTGRAALPAEGAAVPAGAGDYRYEVHGGGGGDQVYTQGGGDKLYGDEGNDRLYSGANDDLLCGGAGADLLLGGKDNDTAVFAGKRGQYQLSQQFGVFTVRDLSGAEGTDTLVNVEHLRFADELVDIGSRTASLSSIATLYRQVLGRQADLAGFQHWAEASSLGMSDGNIALGFLRSTELQERTHVQFDALDTAGKVDFLYQNLLGRVAESAGKVFWMDALKQGVALDEVANGFVHSVELSGQYLAPQGWDFFV